MATTLPTIMQAVCVDSPGRDSQLRWQDCALPKLKPGEVLLKVAAFGINRADLMQRQGLYPPPPGDSTILGLEAAGIVVAVADDNLSPLLGQALFGLVNGGGYADYVAIPAAQAMAVREELVAQVAPAALAARITRDIAIPVIGIGAGRDTDAQVLVINDILGLTEQPPKFSKNFLLEANDIPGAMQKYVADVKSGLFPGDDNIFF